MKRIDSVALLFGLALLAIGCQEYPQGERVYNIYCVNCHMPDGSGLGKLVPSFGTAEFRNQGLDEVVCKVKYGNSDAEDIYSSFNPMPSFTNLSETDISNLLNYINFQLANKNASVSPQDVLDALSNCQPDTDDATK